MNLLIQKTKNEFNRMSTIRKATLIVFAFTILAVIFEMNFKKQIENTPQKSSSDSVDTVIPFGFVLVPVELINQEALTSIISDHAIIDLFSTASLGQKGGIRVGKKLKLIRAPLNPEKFAVLVTEEEAAALMSINGPFSAVIQNRNQMIIGGLEKAKKSIPVVKTWN